MQKISPKPRQVKNKFIDEMRQILARRRQLLQHGEKGITELIELRISIKDNFRKNLKNDREKSVKVLIEEEIL